MRSTVFLVFLLVVAWGPLPRAATQSPAALGRIEGVTFRQGTGDPIPDTLITLTTVATDASPGTTTGAAPAPAPRTALSGRDGRFVFEGLRPGDYDVRAQMDGYFSADDTGGGAFVAAAIVRAAVTARQTREVRFPMILGGTISGRVQTGNGRQAIGEHVQAFRLGFQPDGAPLLQQVSTRSSDDHGEFRFYYLPPGTYYLAVNPGAAAAAAGRGGPGAAPQEVPARRTFYPSALDAAEARPLTLASGEEIEGANIDIRNAVFAKVSGRVFSALPVSAYDPPPPAAPARGASPAPAPAEANSAAVQAALAALEQLRAQRGQSGVVGTAPVTPLPTAQLQLVPRDRRALQDPGMGRTLNAAMAAPNDGNFILENVPPGSYVLYASLPDNSGAAAAQLAGERAIGRAFGRATLDVGATDVSNITITVHHGVDATGRVFSDSDFSELAGMRISLQPDDSAGRIPLYQQIGRYRAEVRADGAFTIPILSEAAYRVQVSFGSGPASPHAFILGVRQDDVDVFDSGFLVRDGPIVPLELFISVKSGGVAGTALDGEGRPVPNAVVVLVPPPDRRHNPARYRTATADAEGKFTLTGVPPGEFKLFAWRSIPAGAHQNAAFIARYENSGLPITVEAGGELRADPRLATAEPGVEFR